MTLTKIQLSNCIQQKLKIDTKGMTTDQMIKIIKHALKKKEFKDIILSTLVLPHCSLPNHNKKDKLCLSTDKLKELAKKNKIKVTTRDKMCKELDSKGLVKIIRKKEIHSPKNKTIRLYNDEYVLFEENNLKTDVDAEQLKNNYRELKRIFHPDKGGNNEKFDYMMQWYNFRTQYGFDKDADRWADSGCATQ